MNTYDLDYMKLQVIANGDRARTLRKMEVRHRNKARRKAHSRPNFSMDEHMMRMAYLERMQLRYEQRHLGLARAFLNGRSYSDVESSTRPGNEADYSEVAMQLWSYGVRIPAHEVQKWIEG